MISHPTPSAPSPQPPPAGPPGEHVEKRRRRKGPELKVAPLNIVPFMDMSFVLLLFLCLAASFSLGEGVLTANLPKGIGNQATDAANPDKPVEIENVTPLTVKLGYVSETECRIAIEGMHESPASFTQLTEYLKKLHKANGGPFPEDTQVILSPDMQVSWQHVVNAFNASVRARFKSIAFAYAKD